MALSQRLGLARNTVQARLSRLEQAGALAPFDRRVLPGGAGLPAGRVRDRAGGAAQPGRGERRLAHIPEVLEVTGLSGVADLLVQVVARDADDLWRITEQVLAIPGVQRIDTALALRRFVDHRVSPAARARRRTERAGLGAAPAPADADRSAGGGDVDDRRRPGSPRT